MIRKEGLWRGRKLETKPASRRANKLKLPDPNLKSTTTYGI